MAWQLIGNQLCYARRYYKGHKPVDLKNSNFNSVILAANNFADRDPGSFALISDLTSFIQVGDLITIGSLGGVTIAEVKEGKKNHEILEFMEFFMKSGCSRSFYYFAQQHGESGVKQLQRMFRQAERMSHVSEVLIKGTSIDPDTKDNIHIPDEYVYTGDWTGELNALLDESDSKDWALDIVDGCLFIGSYSSKAMMGAGHLAFNMWLDQSQGSPSGPRVRLSDTMINPLALPVFNWNISTEHKFDILFGRKNVCIGLNIPMLIERLQKEGLTVRNATNKEASKLDQLGAPPYRHNGKAFFIGNGQQEMAFLDGIFMRVLFHGQRPIETIKAILNAPRDTPN